MPCTRPPPTSLPPAGPLPAHHAVPPPGPSPTPGWSCRSPDRLCTPSPASSPQRCQHTSRVRPHSGPERPRVASRRAAGGYRHRHPTKYRHPDRAPGAHSVYRQPHVSQPPTPASLLLLLLAAAARCCCCCRCRPAPGGAAGREEAAAARGPKQVRGLEVAPARHVAVRLRGGEGRHRGGFTCWYVMSYEGSWTCATRADSAQGPEAEWGTRHGDSMWGIVNKGRRGIRVLYMGQRPSGRATPVCGRAVLSYSSTHVSYDRDCERCSSTVFKTTPTPHPTTPALKRVRSTAAA